MNEYQRLAYEHPIYEGAALPRDTGRFDHEETHNGIAVIVRVTVNVGEEVKRQFGRDAAWHISVSCRSQQTDGDGEPTVAVRAWTGKHRAAALLAQTQNAEGIGRRPGETPEGGTPGEDVRAGMTEDEYAMHLYIPLAGEEREGLELPRYRPPS